MAITLNINMWIRFYFKINYMACSLRLKVLTEDSLKQIKIKLLLTNVVSIIYNVAIIAFFWYMMSNSDVFVGINNDETS